MPKNENNAFVFDDEDVERLIQQGALPEPEEDALDDALLAIRRDGNDAVFLAADEMLEAYHNLLEDDLYLPVKDPDDFEPDEYDEIADELSGRKSIDVGEETQKNKDLLAASAEKVMSMPEFLKKPFDEQRTIGQYLEEKYPDIAQNLNARLNEINHFLTVGPKPEIQVAHEPVNQADALDAPQNLNGGPKPEIQVAHEPVNQADALDAPQNLNGEPEPEIQAAHEPVNQADALDAPQNLNGEPKPKIQVKRQPANKTNTFDASQMKMHLKQHLEQVGDLMTTAENIEEYAEFLGALNDLNLMTEDYYTLSPEGTYPLMTEEGKQKLQTAYQKAIKAAGQIILSEETGAVNAQMRTIAGELLPMLETDNAALEMTNVSRAPVTLPVLVSNARAQAVDMGDQKGEIATGKMSSRQHIKVHNGKDIEEGYFTAQKNADFKKQYAAHMDQMEKKYPAYKPLLDEFRKKSLDEALFASDYGIYNNISLNMTAQECVQSMHEHIDVYAFSMLDIPKPLIHSLKQRTDYAQFLDTFTEPLQQLKKEYTTNQAGVSIQLEDGANIDKRNVGMSRMGRLLGKPGLVAEAKPMMLIQDGKPVVGTFMKSVYGVDLAHSKEGDPITKMTDMNLDTPSALQDIAAMQVIDFICGNVDRHTGNYILNFDSDPKTNPNAKLVGLSLIDNDMSFSDADADAKNRKGSKFVLPEEMGVIGQDTYNAIKSMTKEQMQFALADCGLSQQEIDNAWARKEALQSQIEKDMEFFKDKKPGEVKNGRIRVVPENEWNQYSLTTLATKCEESQFAEIKKAPRLYKFWEEMHQEAAEKEKLIAETRKKLGIPVPEKPEPQENKKIPLGKVIGNGIAQEADPLNVAREDTIKLVVPDLTKIKSVGNFLSERFPMSYQTGNGEQKAFFTEKSEQSVAFRANKVFENAIKKNPKYADDLRQLQTYYSVTEREMDVDFDINDAFTPLIEGKKKYELAGISQDRAEKLRNDPEFGKLCRDTLMEVMRAMARKDYYQDNGVEVGQRIETRNVAMSDVGDVLGVPDLLARSTTAQVMSGGAIIDGVLMNKAEGIDIQNIGDGHPMKLISKEQASTVYNQPEALKKLADLQVLDYICMNDDRHELNMTYQFDGLGTDNPKFTGVQGFDNDASFGTNTPEPTKITVITESMAEKLKDPKLPEQIAEAMQKNNLPESEIEAAKQRLEKIKTAAENGQIRTVKDDEWGKQENNTTIEQLAQAGESIFDVLQNKVIDFYAKVAKQWYEKPAEERITEPTKELKYGQAVKVESFGMNAQEQKQLDDLTKEAEKEFRANIENKISTAKYDDSLSMKEYMKYIKDNSKIMYKELDNADPTFSFTSKEYKQLKKAAKELNELSSKLSKKLRNDGDVLGVTDCQKLVQAMDKLEKCSATYSAKKEKEISEGRQPTPIGRERMQVNENVASATKTLRQEFKKTITAHLAKESSIEVVRRQIGLMQKNIAKESGEKLRDSVAKEIYYKGLERSSLTAKNSPKLADALNPDVVDYNIAQIKQSPAFSQIAQMPDDQLRALGQSGGMLMDKFFKAIGKSKQADAIKQQAQQLAAQANMNKNNPNIEIQ